MRSSLAALSFPVLLASSAVAAAQDPLPMYPDNYRLLFENDRVRVLDFRLRKGDTEKAHHHPAHVAYILEPMRIRFTLADGSTRMREARSGDVLFSEEVVHASENVGDTDAHGILFELKTAADAATPADALTAVTFIDGVSGMESDLERHLLSLAAPTRREPGNLQYDLYRSVARPDRFVRLERWRGAAALEAHKAEPYMRESFEKRKREGWKTQITLWKRVEE